MDTVPRRELDIDARRTVIEPTPASGDQAYGQRTKLLLTLKEDTGRFRPATAIQPDPGELT